MFRTLKIATLVLCSWAPVLASAAPAKATLHDDIPWAEPDGVPLSADIYVPATGRDSYPVVVIYHGGGWLVNDNSIMDATARYLAEQGEFVVANMNYRLLVDNGNQTLMSEIVEDVFGGLLWVKDHIADYGGDPARVAITGDSAGGHLAAMLLTAGRDLSSDGFTRARQAFKPTYLPEGRTAEQVATADGLAVQAAVLSYGAFDLYSAARGGFETEANGFWQWAGAKPRGIFCDKISPDQDPDLYRAVSPLYRIPNADEYRLPPVFAHVGSEDKTTPPEAVKAFVDKMRAAGQPIEYKVYQGKNHAFLDTGCNEFLGNCFEEDAPDTLNDMIAFFDRHLRAKG